MMESTAMVILRDVSTSIVVGKQSCSMHEWIGCWDVALCSQHLPLNRTYRLNALIGSSSYFRAVCSSDDETFLFPSYCDLNFCQQIALCMSAKHPSKRWQLSASCLPLCLCCTVPTAQTTNETYLSLNICHTFVIATHNIIMNVCVCVFVFVIRRAWLHSISCHSNKWSHDVT